MEPTVYFSSFNQFLFDLATSSFIFIFWVALNVLLFVLIFCALYSLFYSFGFIKEPTKKKVVASVSKVFAEDDSQ